MIGLMGEPISAIASCINVTFKLVEFCNKLAGVSEENRIFINLILHVKRDYDNLLRLIRTPDIESFLRLCPRESSNVEALLNDTKLALADIGKYVEDIRVDEEKKGTPKIHHQFLWVLDHHEKLVTRQIALLYRHNSILAEIARLTQIQLCVFNAGTVEEFINRTTPRVSSDQLGKQWLDPEGGKPLRPPRRYGQGSVSDTDILRGTRSIAK